jgi:hypothetical protein
MADAALFLGWGDAVRGRERQALTVFGEAVEFWTRLQQDGEVESFETVFLEPHGGDLAGFFIVRGESEALARLRVRDDVVRLNARAGLIVEHFGVVGGAVGPGIEKQMGYFQAGIDELT